MFGLKIISFFFICLLAGCGNKIGQTDNSAQTPQTKKDELSLTLERSYCHGTCPVYKLNVPPDGKTIFEGIDFTEIKGKAEANLEIEKLNQLVAEINKINFFSLKDDYTVKSGNCPSDATDMPTVTLRIKLNEKEKTIIHYLGCWNKGNPNDGSDSRIFPQQLYNLENKIDEIANTKQWIGEKK